MDRMLPDSFHDLWNGRHWRWLALLSGILLTALLIGLAALVAGLRNEATSPLAFLFVTVLLLIVSMIGSGMFEGLASRTISGGLSRQPASDERRERAGPGDADRSRRDRRTIRCGLVALAPFATFLTILFS